MNYMEDLIEPVVLTEESTASADLVEETVGLRHRHLAGCLPVPAR